MDSIYLTKWGSYVDLSKIVSIDPLIGMTFYVQFQLVQDKTEFWTDHPNNEDQFDDLVNAWKEYKGEKTEGVKVTQPDLQTRL